MVRQRKDKDKEKPPAKIKLAHPDRTAPPDDATLLGLAQKKNLFEQAEERQRELRAQYKKTKSKGAASDDDDDQEGGELSPAAERALDSVLWGLSLATLHFTLDVLVQRQFAVELEWDVIGWRTGLAFVVFAFLLWALHPHPSVSPTLVPGLPARAQRPLRQTLFFGAAVAAGCALVDMTNRYSYLYVMKRTPTLGCLWLWCVVELDLVPAAASLAATGAFVVWGGYSLKGSF